MREIQSHILGLKASKSLILSGFLCRSLLITLRTLEISKRLRAVKMRLVAPSTEKEKISGSEKKGSFGKGVFSEKSIF